MITSTGLPQVIPSFLDDQHKVEGSGIEGIRVGERGKGAGKLRNSEVKLRWVVV